MISAIILTKNNDHPLFETTLSSLSFCDEIIVVDDYSEDNTLKVAKKYGAKVYQRHLDNDWASQRNFALSKAASEWVLFVDSDEIVSKALQQEIISSLSSNDYSAFYLRRIDSWKDLSLTHGEIGHTKLLRLAKKGTSKWKGKVHETWETKAKTKVLKNPLLHLRSFTISEFLTRLNFYTDLVAKEQKSFTYLDLLKPFLKFIYNYIFLLGFLDGFPGLIMAYLMSIHSLSVRVKTWEKKNL